MKHNVCDANKTFSAMCIVAYETKFVMQMKLLLLHVLYQLPRIILKILKIVKSEFKLEKHSFTFRHPSARCMFLSLC